MLSPGTTPSKTTEQLFDLEMIRRICMASGHDSSVEIAVKLRSENQLLRAAVVELSNELDRTAR